MAVRLVILGSGTSHGVPMIACDCRVCASTDLRDRRTRASVLFNLGERGVLVDASPELRLQCLAAGVRRVDAVLFTHHHADHVVGVDDLRRFNALLRGPLPIYGNRRTLDAIIAMFSYAFRSDADYPSFKPQLDPHEVTGPFELWGTRVEPLAYFHGPLPVLGYRIGDIAYCTDCNRIPPETLDRLRGLKVLVLDALRRTPHPTHFNLEQAIEMAQRIGAERTYFTHIAHELLHAEVEAELPDSIRLAYDGLVIEA